MQLTQSAKLRIAQGCERTAFYLVLDLIALYANEKMGYSEASAILLSGLLGGAAMYYSPIQSLLRYAVSSRPAAAKPTAQAIRELSNYLVPAGVQGGFGLMDYPNP